ncbi:short-chain dehydrogenase/reductase SDR [Stanieria cyanosphaera PCC 7437]|uniref:Short-chain dehydrogenase/reductase SDR n=1 Tax=Stanieria cyanosphaera (strain ATCC 29371 / PCC 7437) TaxID=111780 RepID=K9XXH8_STAC7|nr:SDR family oxidoreductase [Stanieria cyanosphaera]AFZ36764.1 short-chain dehydrogenase/reductase SDR [Stanieria cyanosphaera PCC 7437]
MSKNKVLLKKTILITGASTGIGAALAKMLAQEFDDLSLVLAARNQTQLELVADQCRQAGAEVLVVPTDLAQLEQVQNLAQLALQHFGRVDILVNNAGYGQMGPIELIPPKAAQEQFAVNFHAPLVLAQTLIPIMRKQGQGRIVNISSLGGRIPFPTAGMYSCSKFALEALSDVLRMELKAFNIKVTVVEPGPVVTDFFRVAGEKIQTSIVNYKQTPYAPAFENIEAIDQQLDLLGWSAAKTARIIIKAMTARNPRPRYVAATGGNILVFMMTKIFPTWARDDFWKRFYGIDKVEREWKKQLSINSKQ